MRDPVGIKDSQHVISTCFIIIAVKKRPEKEYRHL
jgi:hypothetical protein